MKKTRLLQTLITSAIFTGLAMPASGQIDPALIEKLSITKVTHIQILEGAPTKAILTLAYKNENDFEVAIKNEDFILSLTTSDEMVGVGPGKFIRKDGTIDAGKSVTFMPTASDQEESVKILVDLEKNTTSLSSKLIKIINMTSAGNPSPAVNLEGYGHFGMQLNSPASGRERGWVFTDRIQIMFKFEPRLQKIVPIV